MSFEFGPRCYFYIIYIHVIRYQGAHTEKKIRGLMRASPARSTPKKKNESDFFFRVFVMLSWCECRYDANAEHVVRLVPR